VARTDRSKKLDNMGVVKQDDSMSEDNWFRHSTWTDRDREEFDARLKHSRFASDGAQYLRIQAACLAEAGQDSAAIELLDRLFAEYPDRFQLGQAHLQKAESLVKLGKTESAIQEFRAALQAQRDYPFVRTQACVVFARYVIGNQLTNLYEEVRATIQEFREE